MLFRMIQSLDLTLRYLLSGGKCAAFCARYWEGIWLGKKSTFCKRLKINNTDLARYIISVATTQLGLVAGKQL